MKKHRPSKLLATVFRLTSITLLLSAPLLSLLLFARQFVGTTNLVYTIQGGEIIFHYSSGWQNTPAVDGALCNLPGLSIDRAYVALSSQPGYNGILLVRVRGWLLLLFNLPPLLTAYLLARPLLHRRFPGPNHCPTCGYDLRATPNRCPECGAVPTVRIPPHNPERRRKSRTFCF